MSTSLPKTIRIEIDPTWTAQQIKEYISRLYGVSPLQLSIYNNGRITDSTSKFGSNDKIRLDVK